MRDARSGHAGARVHRRLRLAGGGRGVFEAADGADETPATQAHVATEEGEVFAVREGGLAMIAVAERFTLASLMLFDMRTVLRDLAGGNGVPDRRKPHPRELANEAGGGES